MVLRAKKPVAKEARLKALLFAEPGAGKTHFCCSLPNTYYIDTENLQDYPHLIKMLADNNGAHAYLNDPKDITKEVAELMTTKHEFKNLVIDSISFPFHSLAEMEATRLSKPAEGRGKATEGTEFGANLNKPKRWLFELGMMITRLDMNVIVVAHEKTKYEDGKEIGKTHDVTEKIAHALGATLHLQAIGKKRKLFVQKSRYSELPEKEFLDFQNGYEVLVKQFGENIFTRESKEVKLATKEELNELKRLMALFQVSEEVVQRWLLKGNADRIELLDQSAVQAIIGMYTKRIENVEQTEEC